MISTLKNILDNIAEIDSWKIVEKTTESKELFFIKRELDMNRGKNVKHYTVTVYKNYTENDESYTGLSTVNIPPTMGENEIKSKLIDAALAASFVKNKAFDIVPPTTDTHVELRSSFSENDISYYLPGIGNAIYEHDTLDKGGINSSEVFVNKHNIRILNSKGVDVNFNKYDGEIEVITEWKENDEETELFRVMNFADYRPETISEEVKELLDITLEKAVAKQTPALKDINVILTGESVSRFLSFYRSKSNAQSVYEGISSFKVNENIQGQVKGDLLNITLDPMLENSSASAPFDGEGFPLKAVKLITDGVLKTYHGSYQYTSYLDVEPTGSIANMIVEPGSKTIAEFKSKPYIELIEFSDFQMDPLTGDIGGEIRLARYFDGENLVPVTGGSISANINDLQKEFYLSKETMQINSYKGPKAIFWTGAEIAGE